MYTQTHLYIYIHTYAHHTHTHIYIYILHGSVGDPRFYGLCINQIGISLSDECVKLKSRVNDTTM